MQLKINFPARNRKEDIQTFWTEGNNGSVNEIKLNGKFAKQWLIKINKKDDGLLLDINEDYLEK